MFKNINNTVNLQKNIFKIDENNVINVLELVEQKLGTGNGSNNKDIYVIEENYLYYYEKKGNKTDLWNLGNIGETIEETDEEFLRE